MRAVIDASGFNSELDPLITHKPTPLLQVGGKPIIFHVIEFLMHYQIKLFDILVSYLPEQIEEILGDGARWGIKITYHLNKDPNAPFQAINPFTHFFDDQNILLAQGDCLPKFDRGHFDQYLKQNTISFIHEDHTWTGWAILSLKDLESIPKETIKSEFLKTPIAAQGKQTVASRFISACNLEWLLRSNINFISKEHEFSIFPTTAKMIEQGIWISRGVSLHPLAKIIPPVFIGEFTQIEAYAIIGPKAIIEEKCIIDRDSKISKSLICKGSYVGNCLKITNSIVNRNTLINLAIGSKVVFQDDFILSSSQPKLGVFSILNLIERGIALIFLCLLSPIYLYMKAVYPLKKTFMIKLPAEDDSSFWKVFSWEIFEPVGPKSKAKNSIFYSLPLIKEIVKGNIHFVGVSPRTPEQIENLTADWKKLYLSSKIGLINPLNLENDMDVENDTSDMLYIINKSFFYDIYLIFRWIKKAIHN